MCICRVIGSSFAGLLKLVPDSALHPFERTSNQSERVSFRVQYLNLIAVVFVERTPCFLFSCAHNTASFKYQRQCAVLGIFLVAVVMTCYYRFVARDNKYWPYVFVWSGVNLIFLSFILFYSLATIQNRKWGTR